MRKVRLCPIDFPLMSAEYQAETDSGNNETPSVEIPEETEKPAEPTAVPLPGMETLVKKISFAGMFPMAAPTEISALPETTAVPEETEEPEIGIRMRWWSLPPMSVMRDAGA